MVYYKLAQIEIWYDHCLKLWATQFFNAHGYQMSGRDGEYETDYTNKKSWAVAHAKKYNVKITIENRDGTKAKTIVPIGDGKFRQQ